MLETFKTADLNLFDVEVELGKPLLRVLAQDHAGHVKASESDLHYKFYN